MDTLQYYNLTLSDKILQAHIQREDNWYYLGQDQVSGHSYLDSYQIQICNKDCIHKQHSPPLSVNGG